MFYIYSIKSLETGKVYIGSRTRKVMLNRKPEDDLGIRYFSSTSDKELRRAIKDGKVSYRVIKEYSDAKECVRDENELIRLFWLFFGKENSYNHHYTKRNGEKVWSTAGVESTMKGKHQSEEAKQKDREANSGERNGMYGKGYLLKGERNGMYGKSHSKESLEKAKQTRANKSEEAKAIEHENRSKALQGREPWNKGCKGINSGEKNPAFGRKWMNNGKEQLYVKKDEQEHYLSLGYIFGMLEKSLEAKAIEHENRSKAYKNKPKKKFYWKTTDGKIVVMSKQNASKHHPDWILIGPVE